MPRRHLQSNYQPVTRRRQESAPSDTVAAISPAKGKDRLLATTTYDIGAQPDGTEKKSITTFLKSGHGFTYAALFIFTIILYARPGEFYPSPLTASLALIMAIATLAFFIPTQLSLESTLTARPREVNLVLLFCVTGLLSIPLAVNPATAWIEFSGSFIRCIVMFVIIVNVVRTEARLKGLLLLAIVSALWLSIGAINDYRLGLLTVEGYRASGVGAGLFGNTNDMALHVVTILPICIALMFGSRSVFGKAAYGILAAIMVAAVVLSYSRGAFLGLLVVLIFLALRIGRHHRTGIVIAILLITAALLLFAPGKYGMRLVSIIFPSLDTSGSADNRRGELFRSLYLAIRHPLLGIGMGNYQPEMSSTGKVTHNAYTQVAAEMGMAAFVFYTMFIVTPLRKLGQIVREASGKTSSSHYYYLAVGLQASLLAYMVSSFFLSVAYFWYPYYLVGYAICLRRLYESETGKVVVVESKRTRKQNRAKAISDLRTEGGAIAA
jgi:Lipid A core - O-antigen ligase and related enzymes